MSGDLNFSVNIPEGTQVAAKLIGAGPHLNDEMYLAMNDIEEELITDAQGFMFWKDPTGTLEESIATDSYVPDAWHAVVGSSEPYAHRREYGFSGMTDSLGRYYHNDPGKPYLEPALDLNISYIENRISEAVKNAMPNSGN